MGEGLLYLWNKREPSNEARLSHRAARSQSRWRKLPRIGRVSYHNVHGDAPIRTRYSYLQVFERRRPRQVHLEGEPTAGAKGRFPWRQIPLVSPPLRLETSNWHCTSTPSTRLVKVDRHSNRETSANLNLVQGHRRSAPSSCAVGSVHLQDERERCSRRSNTCIYEYHIYLLLMGVVAIDVRCDMKHVRCVVVTSTCSGVQQHTV